MYKYPGRSAYLASVVAKGHFSTTKTHKAGMNNMMQTTKQNTYNKNNDAKGKPPVASRRLGSVRATVWENAALAEDGTPRTYFNVSFERSYKDKVTGEWKVTESYDERSLAELVALANWASNAIARTTEGAD